MTRWAIFLTLASALLVADILIWQSKLAEPISEPRPRPPLPMYRVYLDPTPTPVPDHLRPPPARERRP